MPAVPLVATTRGYPGAAYTVENVHAGAIAVVDTSGRLLAWAGDPDYPTFTRSALKPFQALPFLLGDGPAHFNLDPAQVALLCASHSGEAFHLAGVGAILDKIGLDGSFLACGCAAPLYYETNNLPPPAGQSWTPLHHNCSGKHSGFLAWCRQHGAPTHGYVAPEHPLQRAIRSTLADAVDLPQAALPSGIDGCSAPNYALPLARLAQLYARLAQGARDARLGQAFGPLFAAMTAHPEMVSGSGRTDLQWMTAGSGDWVAKIGADAVQTIGIASAGIGIAIKVADGNNRGLHTITYHVLAQLGLLDARRRTLLEAFRQPLLRNARGAEVGDIRPLFTLQRA